MSRITASPDTTLTMQSLAVKGLGYSPSVFTGHALKPVVGKGHPSPDSQTDWITGLLIGCFVILAWAQVYYSKRIRQVVLAPFSKRFINQLVRDGNLFRERVAVALGIIYLVSFSLVFYLLNQQFIGYTPPVGEDYLLYMLIVAGLIVYWLFKIMMIKLLAIVFKTQYTSGEYLLNLVIFSLISGLVMLPILVMVIYLDSSVLLYSCLLIIALLFLFRFVRGFLIGITLTKFSYLFLFVYLCTLEILPLLVLSKLLIDHV